MNRRDVLDAQQRFNERVQRQLSTMAPGNPDGRIRSAAPQTAPPPRPEVYRSGNGVGGIVFNFRGALLTAVSDPIPSPADFTARGLAAALRIAGTTSTVVQLEVNGTSVGSVAIAAGQTFAEAAFSATVAAGDILQARVTSAGAGADGLGVIPKAA